MRFFLLKKKFLGGLLAIQCFQSQVVKAEEVWSPFSLEGYASDNNSISKVKSLENKSINSVEPKKLLAKRKSQVIWEPIRSNHLNQKGPLTWEVINHSELPFSANTKLPTNFEEAEILFRQIKPEESDFMLPLRLGPAFPTANQLDQADSQFKVFTLSSFSSGEAGGTGNQNYAFRIDYGATETTQLSGFYSTADDPLYSRINSHSSSSPNH